MNILDYILKINDFKNITSSSNLIVKGSCDESNIALIAADFYQGNKTIYVVLPSLYKAQKYYDELINVIDEEDVLFYPADELMTVELLAASGDFKFERINTILALSKNKRKIIVTHLNGIIKYQFPLEKWEKYTLSIQKGLTYNIKTLLEEFISMGYTYAYTTRKTGEFSHRGSIIDIFPLNSEKPIRLDFFDDEIESIKEFDIDTQRSNSTLDSILITPVVEMIYSKEEGLNALNKINLFLKDNKISPLEQERYDSDLYNIEQHNDVDLLMRYISFFDDNKKTILDMTQDKKIYAIDLLAIEENYNLLIKDLGEYCNSVGGYSIFKLNYFEELYKFKNQKLIEIEGLRTVDRYDYDLMTKEIIPYNANENKVTSDLKMYMGTKTVLCFINNKDHVKTFLNSCYDNYINVFIISKNDEIKINQINIITDAYFPSFSLEKENMLFINEKIIFEKAHNKRKIHYKSIYSNAIKISKYEELVVGDFIVHYDHGIGKYMGIKTMESNGIKRDFIHLVYAKEGALYIPVDQVNEIMKYASSDMDNVKLSTLGSVEWTKTKQRLKTRIHDISEKLIKLYASRNASVGYAFSEDDEMQIQFESEFPYELTLDQAKAVADVKRDMEDTRPMDRLICGDVGYGKTEVAARAAFKAVYNGKQVALLAPTTILSRQHYYTFKSRMEQYGVKVELMNRFVTKKKQNEIIKNLKEGTVDILIGTHRILSNEIVYKNLGLLVVDEEQRFGVIHKEKIKEIKVNVDAITLSATPIPRTLQMSIIGIKDLSMIETPPKNRYPIQTYVLQRNDSIIREAIERELARGGQVFYLYNKVETIHDMARKIHELVPSAKICIGHGKLPKDELEDTICRFIDKEYDVLLCTTIIETGIDMPDTNTLIIHDADALGLSQLYQIRGRVGRSNKIAYAYLMYEPRKKLTETAEKRLSTIKEFNELGSGFKIAMRDLSIRGSGDLLGEEQSGFIDSVGIEMYLKLLEEAIEEEKGIYKEPVKELDTSLKIPLASQVVETSYISNEDIKIEIHKKIDLINSMEDLLELRTELVDRFGEVELSLEIYMYEKLFKKLCNKLDIYRINTDNKDEIILYMSEAKSSKMDGTKVFLTASKFTKDLKLTYTHNQIRIIFNRKNYPSGTYLIILCDYLNQIL